MKVNWATKVNEQALWARAALWPKGSFGHNLFGHSLCGLECSKFGHNLFGLRLPDTPNRGRLYAVLYGPWGAVPCRITAVTASPSEVSERLYKGTSRTRKRTPLGPYRRPMPRVLGWA